MTSTESETNLKAGHPKAEKVGGMRVKKNKTQEKETGKCVTEEANLLKIATSPTKITNVAGAPITGHGDFSTAAVKDFHEKPLPTVENRPHNAAKCHIQQPRK